MPISVPTSAPPSAWCERSTSTPVCEEAGCPNIYECWADRTATFMILGDRCTRACGFCLVDTRKPFPIDPEEPARVAEAVAALGLEHAVITSVARDDVDDGGAAGFAATIRAIRARNPRTRIEVLIPDCKGDPASLDVIFDARPDVLNHNLETVARLQRAARPSAGYARSLALLARAKDADLLTKSGIILGMGETADEVRRDRRSPQRGCRRAHPRSVPAPVAAAPAGGALVDSRRVRRARRVRRRPRLRSCGSGSVGAIELSRQAGATTTPTGTAVQLVTSA